MEGLNSVTVMDYTTWGSVELLAVWNGKRNIQKSKNVQCVAENGLQKCKVYMMANVIDAVKTKVKLAKSTDAVFKSCSVLLKSNISIQDL